MFLAMGRVVLYSIGVRTLEGCAPSFIKPYTRSSSRTHERAYVGVMVGGSPFGFALSPTSRSRLYIGLDLLDARPHLGRTLGPSLFRICIRIIPAISPHQCSKFFDRARPTTASRLANVVPSRLVVPDHSLRYRIDAPGVGICPPWHL